MITTTSKLSLFAFFLSAILAMQGYAASAPQTRDKVGFSECKDAQKYLTSPEVVQAMNKFIQKELEAPRMAVSIKEDYITKASITTLDLKQLDRAVRKDADVFDETCRTMMSSKNGKELEAFNKNLGDFMPKIDRQKILSETLFGPGGYDVNTTNHNLYERVRREGKIGHWGKALNRAELLERVSTLKDNPRYKDPVFTKAVGPEMQKIEKSAASCKRKLLSVGSEFSEMRRQYTSYDRRFQECLNPGSTNTISVNASAIEQLKAMGFEDYDSAYARCGGNKEKVEAVTRGGTTAYRCGF